MSRNAKFYHASVSLLPEGTTLHCDSGRVYMSKDTLDAHDWAHLLGNPYLYLVEPNGPVEKRYQKDALGDWEYLTDSATVVRYLGKVDDSRTEYCDGCLPWV